MKYNFKRYLVTFLSFFFLSFAMASSADLLTNDGSKGMLDNLRGTGDAADYNTTGGDNGEFVISKVANTIIKAFLGILGIIFLIMILIGGFNWMTAAGNSGKVEDAKATLYRGVIGLIILVTAYAITAFVFRALSGIVGAAK